MDRNKISHDILNLIERLRIMHDMVKGQKYEVISKEEIQQDLDLALRELETKFTDLLQ